MLICLDQRNGNGCNATNHNNSLYCSQCGASLRYALHLHDRNTVIGDYRILDIVGHGGFGAVYQAEHMRRPGSKVAIKETFDTASIQQFHDEFAALRNHQHPHLPKYLEAFEFDGNGYLVMEFVPGQTLDDIINLQEEPLVEAQVLGYGIQLCDVLNYLHSQKPSLVHRDIKPANVRITPSGLIKLVDFGLVKQGRQRTRSTILRLGTPEYAPLEQFGGGTDERSDIYSLGATLYHLLTKEIPPLATERISSSTDPLRSPKSIHRNISEHVSDALLKAMSLRRDERFATAEEFKQALLGNVQAPLQLRTRRSVLPSTLRQNTSLYNQVEMSNQDDLAKVGDRVESGGVALSVLKVEWGGSPQIGLIWLFAEVVIESTTKNSALYSYNYFKVQDSNNYRYESEYVDKNWLKTGTLAKHDKVRGTVGFKVAQDATELILSYSQDIGRYHSRFIITK